MFSPSSKRPERMRPPAKPVSAQAKKRMIAVVLLTILLLVVYYGCIALGFVIPVMVVYMVAFAALLITYIAYNRGFVNKDVTVDMLPADWSEEKKQAFVDGNRIRAEKSRWMLTYIIPFIFVFMVEALYLFVWEGWMSNLFK